MDYPFRIQTQSLRVFDVPRADAEALARAWDKWDDEYEARYAAGMPEAYLDSYDDVLLAAGAHCDPDDPPTDVSLAVGTVSAAELEDRLRAWSAEGEVG